MTSTQTKSPLSTFEDQQPIRPRKEADVQSDTYVVPSIQTDWLDRQYSEEELDIARLMSAEVQGDTRYGTWAPFSAEHRSKSRIRAGVGTYHMAEHDCI